MIQIQFQLQLSFHKFNTVNIPPALLCFHCNIQIASNNTVLKEHAEQTKKKIKRCPVSSHLKDVHNIPPSAGSWCACKCIIATSNILLHLNITRSVPVMRANTSQRLFAYAFDCIYTHTHTHFIWLCFNSVFFCVVWTSTCWPSYVHWMLHNFQRKNK